MHACAVLDCCCYYVNHHVIFIRRDGAPPHWYLCHIAEHILQEWRKAPNAVSTMMLTAGAISTTAS
jgi:hypothetical protein